MGDDTPVPVFTGAELALADALILIMKVMAMHGVIDAEAIDTVFSDLENRYRRQALNCRRHGRLPAPACDGCGPGPDAAAAAHGARRLDRQIGLNHNRVNADQ